MSAEVRESGTVGSYATAVRELGQCEDRLQFARRVSAVLSELLADAIWHVACVSRYRTDRLEVLASHELSWAVPGDVVAWTTIDTTSNHGPALRVQLIGTHRSLGYLEVRGTSPNAHIALRHHAETLGAIIGSALEHVDQQRQLEQLAAELLRREGRDQLTNALGRDAFGLRLDNALKSVSTGATAATLCLVDVDHFSLVNAAGGHAFGDAALREIAHRIQSVVSRTDPITRLGGDRFGILLLGCAEEEALSVAERIRAMIDEIPLRISAETVDLTVTIGLSRLTAATPTALSAIAEADAACFAGKHAGRNRVVMASASDRRQRERLDEATAVHDIKQAADEDRFVVLVQPIVDLAHHDLPEPNLAQDAAVPQDDSVVDLSSVAALEFLVRLPCDRTGELTTAGSFVPPAERFNLVHLIDQWVARAALDALRSDLLDQQTGVFINVSPQSIETDGFVAGLDRLIDESMTIPGKGPDHLCFEITETAAIEHFDLVRSFSQHMRDRGCRIALDDFGSGTSSLGQLKKLPVDFVKIDGALVRDVASDPISRTMITAVQTIASALGAKTIAEHVEDAATAATLRSLGVTYAQGYYYAKPAPLR